MLNQSNQQDQTQQFLCRRLELSDFNKGFMTCQSYLTQTPEITFEKFKEIFNNFSGIVFVIEDTQQKLIVSSISLVIDENIFDTKYYIENVVTIPEYRGRGLMKQLMEKIIEEVKLHKIKINNQENTEIELYCNDENKGIYKKLGFDQVGLIYSQYF